MRLPITLAIAGLASAALYWGLRAGEEPQPHDAPGALVAPEQAAPTLLVARQPASSEALSPQAHELLLSLGDGTWEDITAATERLSQFAKRAPWPIEPMLRIYLAGAIGDQPLPEASVAWLYGQITSRREEARAYASAILAVFGDADPDARERASLLLRQLVSERGFFAAEHVPALARLLHSPTDDPFGVKETLARGLAGLGRDALPLAQPLIALLVERCRLANADADHDEYELVDLVISRALSEMGDEVVPSLLASIREHAPPGAPDVLLDPRDTLIDALFTTGHAAVPAVVELLASGDAYVQSSLLDALREAAKSSIPTDLRVGRAVIALLRDGRSSVRLDAAETLTMCSRDLAPELLDVVADPQVTMEIKYRAMAAARTHGAPLAGVNRQVLLAMLTSRLEEARLEAARVLVAHPEDAQETLGLLVREMLVSASQEQREDAVDVVLPLARRARPALAALLVDDNLSVRSRALDVLARFEQFHPDERAGVEASLQLWELQARVRAAAIIAREGDVRAIPHLRDAMRIGSPTFWGPAATGAAALGAAGEALLPELLMRAQAEAADGEYHFGSELDPRLSEAIQAVGRHHPNSIAPWLALPDEPKNRSPRLIAAHVLASSGADGIARLSAVVHAGESPLAVRAAIEALGGVAASGLVQPPQQARAEAAIAKALAISDLVARLLAAEQAARLPRHVVASMDAMLSVLANSEGPLAAAAANALEQHAALWKHPGMAQALAPYANHDDPFIRAIIERTLKWLAKRR